MDPFVFFAVLVAAACHAGWNAFLKTGLEPLSAMTLIAVMSTVFALLCLPFAGLPAFESWPYLLASMIFHLGYFIGLTEAYRVGDMSQVYPIARGSAPLMTAVVGAIYVGEAIGLYGWIGIVLLASGIFFLSMRGGRDLARVDRRAVGFALATAVTICGYSIADGLGGRISGNPHGYAIMLFLLDGGILIAYALMRRGTGLVPACMPYWKTGLAGGALSLAAYWIAIWAMSVAPIAVVAALRETSVLFAAVIAVLFLKEPLRGSRFAAAAIVVAGLVLIRLS